MSALEHEIIEKFQLLDDNAKRRVLDMLSQEAEQPFDAEAWLQNARALRESIRAGLSEGETIDTLALLDEIRHERP